MKITTKEYNITRGHDTGKPVYIQILDTIVSVDERNGGAEIDIIVQHKDSNKFYAFTASLWDLGEDNKKYELQEVKPVQIMMTTYVGV